MNNRGVALILVTVLLVTLTIFSTGLISSSFSENAFAEKYLKSTQAFWLAEAGVSKAMNGLRTNSDLRVIAATPLGKGGYSVEIVANADGTYTITSHGFIPFDAPFRAERVIQVVVDTLEVPDDFYDYVIWSATNILIKGTGQGNYASITGAVISGGDINTTPASVPLGNIIKGTVSTNDDDANPLPLLNFDLLRVLSQSQIKGDGSNNYYDAERLKNPSFPTSFWYNESLKIPNIVFLEGDLVLSGNINVGGFFIVGGESMYTTTVTGTVRVDGVLYTPGPLEIKGGGANLNINGGLWAGAVLLNGSMTLTYNPEYMKGIKGGNPGTTIQSISWRETQNPYRLD